MTRKDALWTIFNALSKGQKISDDEASEIAPIVAQIINEDARREMALKEVSEMSSGVNDAP